jgi:uncharacterized protein YjbI with pentapeptide repeats
VLVLVAVIGFLALAVPSIWVLPERLYPPLTEPELRDLTPDQRLQRLQGQRTLQNGVRAALVQGLVGVLALTGAAIGASVAWRQYQENRRHQQHNEELSREQLKLGREQLDQALVTSQGQLQLTQEELRLSRESQVAERFTKAIEQLGSDKLDVRLGGIYALERLAHDSPQRDHPTVVEVLGAFVREGSRRYDTPPPKQGRAEEAAVKLGATTPGTDAKPRPATDIQAALSVLGRLPQQPNVSRGDLTGVQVAGAQLGGADLTGAQLVEADLSGAHLHEADLSGAQLRRANLTGAWFVGANLSGANLREAKLSGAQLGGANLKDARLAFADLSGAQVREVNLSGAHLHGADLRDARLRGADLTDALLGGAKLRDARLGEAKLRQARELTQPQLNGAWGDALTQLPAELERPASWTATAPPASPGPPR